MSAKIEKQNIKLTKNKRAKAVVNILFKTRLFD